MKSSWWVGGSLFESHPLKVGGPWVHSHTETTQETLQIGRGRQRVFRGT